MAKFINVGFTAMIDHKTGNFLEPIPLYTRATPELEIREKDMVEDLRSFFGEWMKQYIYSESKQNKETKVNDQSSVKREIPC